MSDIRVDFAGSEEIIASVVTAAEDHGVKHTGARDAGSNVEALNAPMTGAEIILAAKVVTAVFKAGATIVAFIVALRAALKQDQTVTVKLGKKKLTLTSETPDETIRDLAA